MKKITVPVKDILHNDVIEINNVVHKVFTTVNHPAGFMILGGYKDNTYVIASFSRMDTAFSQMEVSRR